VTLRESLSSAISRLAAANAPSPRMNAELLLRFTLECDRAYLYAHPERELSADEQHRYDQVLAERARGVPAQYITGHQEFWGMDLIVTPAVLVPRPETEHVVETVLQLVGVGRAPSPAALRLVDAGCGSGCIALALAKELPQAEIHAKSPAPTAHATSSKAEFASMKPTCCKGWNPAHSILSSPIHPTSANPKKTRSSSKCASLNRARPFSLVPPDSRSSHASSRKPVTRSSPEAGW
jgi:hypothetical protein